MEWLQFESISCIAAIFSIEEKKNKCYTEDIWTETEILKMK